MNTTQKIKALANNTLPKVMTLSEKIINPQRDWMILIVIFAVFILSSIGFDAYIYQQIKSGDMYVSVNKNELTIESLKTNDLQKILDSFDNKKTAMLTLKIVNLVDPSL